MRRVCWAKKYVSKPLGFWRKTLFSDKAQICLFQGVKNARVYREPGEGHLPQHLWPTVKHSQAVMLWGSFSYKGVGRISILETGQRMNSLWYKSILEREVQDTMIEHFGGLHNANFQDDGAPCHRSHMTRDECEELGIRQLEWPGQSPDPIENLWSLVKSKVRSHQPRTLAELKEVIRVVWTTEIPCASNLWTQ
jgi:hypothetical protein